MRIVGVNIPENKKLSISLTYIYGIGKTSALAICEKAGVAIEKKVKDLTNDEVLKVRGIVDEEYTVEGELRTFTAKCIKRLKDIQCYRGIRHIKGLPVRGQRTKTNARTRKGKKKI